MTVQQTTAGGEKAIPVQPLALGEQMEVLVLRQSPDQKALLKLRDSVLTADAPFPLPIGGKLTVCVDQLQPTIVLRLLNQEDLASARTSDYLKFHRSNPQALKEMFINAQELFAGEQLQDLSKYLPKSDIPNVKNLLNQLILSKENLANPLFLKNYVNALGLTDERKLLNTLSDPAVLKETPALTLKEAFQKWSSASFRFQSFPDDTPPDIQQMIRKVADFSEQATKVIESLQIVNVLAREQDGLFTLQIPLRFPEGIKMQDIFIESDRKKGDRVQSAQCRIVLFLDMDALGEMAVDAAVKDEGLRCTIKCQGEEVREFMHACIPQLSEKLSGAGYKGVSVQCLLDKDIGAWKNDFLFNHQFFQQNTINVCA